MQCHFSIGCEVPASRTAPCSSMSPGNRCAAGHRNSSVRSGYDISYHCNFSRKSRILSIFAGLFADRFVRRCSVGTLESRVALQIVSRRHGGDKCDAVTRARCLLAMKTGKCQRTDIAQGSEILPRSPPADFGPNVTGCITTYAPP